MVDSATTSVFVEESRARLIDFGTSAATAGSGAGASPRLLRRVGWSVVDGAVRFDLFDFPLAETGSASCSAAFFVRAFLGGILFAVSWLKGVIRKGRLGRKVGTRIHQQPKC